MVASGHESPEKSWDLEASKDVEGIAPKAQEGTRGNQQRTAKWWYSTFHNVTAMVGAGVLGLPYTMKYLGWGPGMMLHVISWTITLYTLWQLVQLHEVVPGKRFDGYQELAQHAFGQKLGLWIMMPPNLGVQVGVDIVYIVTGGQCLAKSYNTLCTSCTKLRQSYWILILGSLHFFLCFLPNLNSVTVLSLAAAVMSLSYSTIGWAACLYRGRAAGVEYSWGLQTGSMFRVLNAVGVIAFAYAGHNVALEIQATLPSTPREPSKVGMWKGVVGAYLVVGVCYFPVTMLGYWAFGNHVDDNLLLTLRHPEWLIAAANVMVVIHVIGSYQVFAMPVYDLIEKILKTKLRVSLEGFPLRLATRIPYVAFTLLVAVTFPFFGDLLGFFGGLAFAPTTYFLPCMMWLAIKKPRRWSPSWIVNWFCIIFGCVIMIASIVGGFRSLQEDASTYKFYQ